VNVKKVLRCHKPLNFNFIFSLIFFFISWLCPLFAAPSPAYLFGFFVNNGEDGLHLAYSADGKSFSSLNNNQSLIKPVIGKDRLMRDPSVVRGPDGLFHLVWTSGWNDRCIGHASSPDLISWSKQDSIFVMKNEPTAQNCWAPEIFYDDASEQYIIIWSTTIPGKFPETQVSCESGNNHRLYYVTSKDMKVFSETKLFYDPGFNCIDGFIARDSNRYVLVLKNETCADWAKGSSSAKNFRIAFSNNVIGPYGNLTGVITTGNDWVEGPSIIKIGSEWFLYYDIYTQGRYGIRKSGDLSTWQNVTDNMNKPSGARHGTVFAVNGLIIDNKAQAGFRWEPVGTISRRQSEREITSCTFSCDNKSLTIKTLTGGTVSIYALNSRLLYKQQVSPFIEHRIPYNLQKFSTGTALVVFKGLDGLTTRKHILLSTPENLIAQ
jgi:hypothetical protein